MPWLRRQWQDLRQTLAEWRRDEGDLLAAGFSYYAILSLFPLLIVLMAAFAIVLAQTDLGEQAQEQVFRELETYVSKDLANNLRVGWSEIQNRALVNGPIGLFILALTTIPLFARFERAFDRIWKVERPAPSGVWGALRNVLVYRLKAFMMLMCLGLLLIAILVIGMLMESLEVYSQIIPAGQRMWDGLEGVSILLMNAAVFTLIYRVIPKTSVRLNEAARGGVMAAITWELGRQVLSTILIGSRYSAYGVVGSLLAVMLWIYYGATVLFFWAEYVHVICERSAPLTLPQLARTAQLTATEPYSSIRTHLP